MTRIIKSIFIILFAIGLILSARGFADSASAAPHREVVAAFLYPPYPGTASQESVFDHSAPYYVPNKRVVAFNGEEAFKNCPAPQPAGKSPPQDGICDAGYGIYWSYGLGSWMAYDGHDGIDYGMNYRPVYAAADTDRVAYAGWSNPQDHRVALGLYVKLHHPNGYSTTYGHLSAVVVQSCPLDGCVVLSHGEWIGFSGNTGNTSGPHLHLQLTNPVGRAVDPYGWQGSGADPWSYDQPESLWVQYPALYYYNAVILPSGEPLAFPSAPPIGYIIDDSDAGFTEIPDSCWEVASSTDAQNGSFRYINPHITVVTCSAQWAFPKNSRPGLYSVYIRIPSIKATSQGARYIIQHNNSADLAYLNQDAYPNRFYATDGWVYLGKYNFSGAGDEYIRLTNQTLDELAGIENLDLSADAVRFVFLTSAAPTPTQPGIVTLAFTPSNTFTPTVTRTPTITRTATMTRTPSHTPMPTNTRRPTPTPPYTKVNIYFVDNEKYNADNPPYEAIATRWTKSNRNFPQYVLNEYFKGPGDTEKNTYGWIALYNEFTGYKKMEIADGIARVYLKGGCNSGGATYTIADLLKMNLKQFSRIQYVKIYDQNGQTQNPDGASDSIPACLEP